MTRGVYVASRASISARGEMWRAFRAEGVVITSSWIDEDGPGQTPSMADLWERIQREISVSTHLVLYVEKTDLPLKGAFIEAGMALMTGLHVNVVARGFEDQDEVKRLVGSWTNHRKVSFFDDVGAALRTSLVTSESS